MQKSIIFIVLFWLAIFPFKQVFCSDTVTDVDNSSFSVKDLFLSSNTLGTCSYISDINLTQIINSNHIKNMNAILLKGNLVANCIQWEKLKPCTLKKDSSSVSHPTIAKVDIPEDGIYTVVRVYPNPAPSDYTGSYNDSLDLSKIQSLSIDLIKTPWLEKGVSSILLSENVEFHYECSLGERTE